MMQSPSAADMLQIAADAARAKGGDCLLYTSRCV